jgi:hypothetical protein
VRKPTVILALFAALSIGCPRTPAGLRASGDGLDPRSVPAAYRADYDLFAHRCSKCHSLSRALDNGHVEDEFWRRYVERMRRQPGSAIAPEDVPPILRFLHYYSQAPR